MDYLVANLAKSRFPVLAIFANCKYVKVGGASLAS